MSSGVPGATASHPDGSPESFLRSFVPISAKHLVLQSEYRFVSSRTPLSQLRKICRLLIFVVLPETVVKFDANFTGYPSICETEPLSTMFSDSSVGLRKYATPICLQLTLFFPKE